jgi:hypothetical protein
MPQVKGLKILNVAGTATKPFGGQAEVGYQKKIARLSAIFICSCFNRIFSVRFEVA